jgi:hypothetical protein
MSAKSEVVSKKLVGLRRRVEHWRKRHGGPGSRVPDELWQAAVSVARVEGVHATSRVLRLGYGRLKARVEANGEGRTNGEREAGFIELGTGQLCGGSRTMLELIGQRGGQMRIDISGPTTVDLVGLTQAFWSCQS